jgi:predicted nucleotidyltransferase component of viral defense system
MNNAIKSMLDNYNCQNPSDYKSALKEIMQEVALLGLSRQNFFKHAAFYGGTALRIAHKLDRYSEDLDFTLLKPNASFKLDPYLKGLEDEFTSYGLKISATKIQKEKDSAVDSAFLKGNTLLHLMMIEGFENPTSGTQKNEVLKIKFEIDTQPPLPSGETEVRFHHNPIPFEYSILKMSSLYSGKLHAVLCRDWKDKRVKGRDFYDFIWYRKKEIVPDLPYLEAKLKQSGHYNQKTPLTKEILDDLLRKKFEEVNWEMAKQDIAPFIKDQFALTVWSKNYFQSLI